MSKVYENNNLHDFCGLVVYYPKLAGNVGVLFRTAAALGNVNFLATIGERYGRHHSDTACSWKQIPTFRFETFDDFIKSVPLACDLVALEIGPRSEDLSTFNHPRRAVYMVGAEDEGLPDRIYRYYRYKVALPSPNGFSMNLAASGSILLYDRFSKMRV